MRSLLDHLAGILTSLLPEEYRKKWAWAATGNSRVVVVVSGIFESATCLLIAILRYFTFLEWRTGTIFNAAQHKGAAAGMASEGVAFAVGATSMFEYLLRPLTVVLIYFTVEGAVRVLAAWAGEETVGTLPLYLLAGVVGRIQASRRERALGERVVDQVQHCEGISYDLTIASCRPKSDWTRLTTIEYQDQLYELFEEKRGFPPRPFIYRLRKLSPGKVIRGLHHYQPDEVLTENQKQKLVKAAAR